MNDDLIYRSAVLDALKTEEGAAILGNSHVRYMKAKTLVEEIPAVDAVEVVRCKDCKHSYKGSPHGLMCECPVGGQNTSLLGGDDFCSNGERRVDDGD